jgi:hypothetical protein
MKSITPYIILDSKSHIVWDLFYFETTSIFLIPSFEKEKKEKKDPIFVRT